MEIVESGIQLPYVQGQGAETVITVRNPNPSRSMAFKVMTTRAKAFHVKPLTGMCAALQQQTVRIILKPPPTGTPPGVAKFQLQSVLRTVEDEANGTAVKALFQRAKAAADVGDSGAMQSAKILCEFVSPATDSSTATPLIAADDPSRKQSVYTDARRGTQLPEHGRREPSAKARKTRGRKSSARPDAALHQLHQRPLLPARLH